MPKIKQVEGLQQLLDSKLDDIQLKSSGELPIDWPNPQESYIPSQVAIKEYIENTVIGDGIFFRSVRFNLTDNDMEANETAADGDLACNLAISEEPILDTGVRVFINGHYEYSGNTINDVCYFSNDGGITAKAFGAEEIGDLLYWNSSIAGYNLAITDTITFKYLVYFNVEIIPGTIGSGDVIGPSGATDSAIALYNTNTGKLLKNSTVIIDTDGRFNSINTTIGTNTTETIDTVGLSISNSVKYNIICENGITDILLEEILVYTDGTLVYYNEYGIIDKGTGLSDLTITFDIHLSNIRLILQNTSLTKSYTVRTSKIII